MRPMNYFLLKLLKILLMLGKERSFLKQQQGKDGFESHTGLSNCLQHLLVQLASPKIP